MRRFIDQSPVDPFTYAVFSTPIRFDFDADFDSISVRSVPVCPVDDWLIGEKDSVGQEWQRIAIALCRAFSRSDHTHVRFIMWSRLGFVWICQAETILKRKIIYEVKPPTSFFTATPRKTLRTWTVATQTGRINKIPTKRRVIGLSFAPGVTA